MITRYPSIEPSGEFLAYPEPLTIGSSHVVTDKYTKETCKAYVLRTATVDEWLQDPRNDGCRVPQPGDHYYHVSMD